MIALFVVGLGAVLAAVGTAVLAARSARRPRIYLLAWTVALFGLAVGLGATTVGYVSGFSGVIFRAMELGTALIAPLALCVTLVEILGRRLSARFCMRLVVSAIFVVAVVILATDPINPNVTFTKRWPEPAIFYQIAPLGVLGFLALFTAVTAAVALLIAVVRSSRGQVPEARPAVILSLAALAVELPGLAWLAQKLAGIVAPLPPKDIFAASCTLAAGLAWYAASAAGGRDIGQAAAEDVAGGYSDGDWDDVDGAPEAGEFDDFRRPGQLSSSYNSSSRRAGPDYGRRDVEADYFDGFGGDFNRDGEYAGRTPPTRGRSYDDADSDYRYPGLAALVDGQADPSDELPPLDSPGYDDSAQFGSYHQLADQPAEPDEARRHFSDDLYPDDGDEDPHGQLFGQITIYTLVDGRADDFDRLTEWIMILVRAKEPNTLVYIVHAVPTAPSQRILYEVYRNRAAYAEHLQRSYVKSYEAEQRPFVLATNVIELGLQQAKVSPLPSISAISDILSESGIDLTGVTGSSQPAGQPRVPGYYRSAPPDQAGRFGYGDNSGNGSRQPDYEAPYQGWADIRGEDSRY